jgi:hypothetical protein
MAKPLSICIEDCTAPEADARFTQCVAVERGTPGLSLGPDGTPAWQVESNALLLAVGEDGRLVLDRGEGAPAVQVNRAGRVLEPSAEGPTVLLDQDEIALGERRLRIHVHGASSSVAPPRPAPDAGGGCDAEEETPVIQAPGGITSLRPYPDRPEPLPTPVEGDGPLPDEGGSPDLAAAPKPPAPPASDPPSCGPWPWVAGALVLGAAIFALWWFAIRA